MEKRRNFKLEENAKIVLEVGLFREVICIFGMPGIVGIEKVL